MSTIREVAKVAGVSIASVSRVINNDKTYQISKEKRLAILNAVEQLNYHVPNSYKRTPSTIIGCIQRLTIEGSKDSYYAAISQGIVEGLNKRGIQLQFTQTQLDFEKETNFELIFPLIPEGLIIMGEINEKAYDYIKSKVKYIVGIDTMYDSIDNIRYNRYQAGIIAVNHLVSMGHKQIAYIGAHINFKSPFNLGRFFSYKSVLQANNLTLRHDYIIDCEWKKSVCFKKTIELLSRKDRPTAIFVASDHMAIVAMSAITSLNLKVGEDISIVAISDIEDSAYLDPPLTTVSIPQKEMGELAATTLLHRMDGDNSITKQIFVPCQLIVRKSVKKLVD